MENEVIKLRDAAAADLPLLVEVIQDAYREYEGRLDPPSGSHTEDEEKIGQKLARGGGILAFVGAVAAGSVLFETAEDHIYLGRLAVRSGFRGRGLGGRLVAAVEARAQQWGKPRVILAVRLALAHNIEFYQKRGYKIDSYHAHEGYSTPTYVLMRKDLL